MTSNEEQINYLSINQALDESNLKSIHLKVWSLSAMGVFLDGFDLFIIGVCLPLIVKDLSPSPAMQGLIGAAVVLGAIVGSGEDLQIGLVESLYT